METKLMMQVAAAFEIAGGMALSEAAKELMFETLSAYSDEDVARALSMCMREVRGRLAVADIIARIPSERPSPEEAWSMIPRDEASTAMWTAEMRDAYGQVWSLAQTDPVAARMAFRDAYHRACIRAHGTPVRWSVSLGNDPHHRATVIREAVAMGRLTDERARKILPEYDAEATPKLFGEAEDKRIKQLVDGLTVRKVEA